MLNLAGKYARDLAGSISRNPIPSALAGAALAGGLATAGNLVSGEAGREGPGRLISEAVGAGALGALGGYNLPSTRLGLYAGKKALARELAEKGAERKATGAGMQIGVSPEAENLRQAAKRNITAMNVGAGVGTGLGYLGAGAMGGMIGGGVANVPQMIGVPGFQQNVITDPELAASSNTQMARSYTPTLRYLS